MFSKCCVCKSASEKYLTKDNCQILRCQRCGLYFIDPETIPTDYLKQYKARALTNKYYQLTREYDIRSFEIRVKAIGEYFPSRGSMLEIGAGIGTFANLAQKSGWKYLGVEPNNEAYNFWIKSKKPFPFLHRYFNTELAQSHKGRYDVIYSGDVIEHILNPLEFLKNARKLLKKDGLIFTVTPDFDSILSKLTQIKPSEHVIYLNKQNIKTLYARAGLKIVEVRNTHRYRNLAAMADNSYQQLNYSKPINLALNLIKKLRLQKPLEIALGIFREDLFIVAASI